jgi:hypothetical protein
VTSVNPGSSQDEPPTNHPHYELIIGLMRLAAFLTDHPDLPVDSVDAGFSATGTDSDQIAQVRQIGHLLDADPSWQRNYFVVNRMFGPVKYSAWAIPAQAHEEFLRREELGRAAFEAVKAAAAAAAAETVEVVVVVDPPAAAPVDEGQAVGEQDTRPCPSCDGSGGDESRGAECRSCWGSGRVLAEPPKCAGCGGSGRAIDKWGMACDVPCGYCHGTGYKQPAASAW